MQVFVVVYDQFRLLDATGPADVFATATEVMDSPSAYRVALVCADPGPVSSSSGVQVLASPLPSAIEVAAATVVVVGGPGAFAASARDGPMLQWLRGVAPRAQRLCAVCTGTFLLAKCGLLTGRQAVTHWRHVDALKRAYPEVDVNGDALFVKSGHVYSSAGIAAGIDLCLHLVEEDFGRTVAMSAAKRLVVHMKRPGGQLQFSSELLAQTAGSSTFDKLVASIKKAPEGDWSVERMAADVNMSARSFHRRFVTELGTTPSKYVEGARVEKACSLIESGRSTLKVVSQRAGFSNWANMKNAFVRRIGATPSDYLNRFRR